MASQCSPHSVYRLSGYLPIRLCVCVSPCLAHWCVRGLTLILDGVVVGVNRPEGDEHRRSLRVHRVPSEALALADHGRRHQRQARTSRLGQGGSTGVACFPFLCDTAEGLGGPRGWRTWTSGVAKNSKQSPLC